jgi:hypothetical protein
VHFNANSVVPGIRAVRRRDHRGRHHRPELAQTRLDRVALHDPLTGLPNCLLDHPEKALLDIGSTEVVGLLSIVLDNVRNLNGEASHLVGDQLLMMVARGVREWVPLETPWRQPAAASSSFSARPPPITRCWRARPYASSRLPPIRIRMPATLIASRPASVPLAPALASSGLPPARLRPEPEAELRLLVQGGAAPTIRPD